MHLATIRTDGGTAAVRVDGDEAAELDVPDVSALLADADWRQRAQVSGATRPG